MPSIGPITIPTPVDAGTWPLVGDHGSSMVIHPKIVEHVFGSSNAKVTQRFVMGPLTRRFNFRKSMITRSEMDSLLSFWETARGPYSTFSYTHRAKDGSATYTVRFADASMSWDFLQSCVSQTGVQLLEVLSSPPTYSVSSTVDRFPGSTLNTALLQQVQECIPLVRIRAKDSGVADIFLSDRLVTIGGNRYEPRILQWGGISQSLGESSDVATFTLGNADDVLTDLVAAVDLAYAQVDFSIFHVGTLAKIDLWTGFLNVDGAWQINDREATMEIRATDGLATTTAAYPMRALSPQCWKEFNDGRYCPASIAGGTNLSTPCDKGWDTAAGCVFHGMQPYFGGFKQIPALVQLKQQSFFGLKETRLSASSVLNDGVYGRPLKEVYTDVPMPVPCDVAAGRDESEYKAGIGIVGAGPIGAFGYDLTQMTLDGVGPHGGNTGLGFRAIPGNDPIVDTAKERMGFDEASAGWNPPSGTPYAAGVAAIQVRRTDAKGIQGFSPSQWQMSAQIALGVGGWKWTAAGSRSWVSGITNNVWIAVNAWLKINGAWCDNPHASVVSVSQMEALFDVPAAIAAAAICDSSVTPIIGSGLETQFKFCGIIGEFKPFRQWLQLILDGAMCDYSFRNGKLRISARVNASAATGFGPGNTLFRSLNTTIRAPRFNHLTVSFGDEEFKFQRNSVELYDETHAKRRTAGVMPAYIKQEATPAGVTRKSHAARLNIALLREQLGGATTSEQLAARNVSWSSTILALEAEPGTVASFTGFRKLPDGSKARITKWVLNPDYSITFYGETVTNSMYDFTIGPKPADVIAGPAGIERAPAAKARRWFPNTAAPDSNDPIFSQYDLSFAAGISYEDLADGSKRAILNVQGCPHVNTTLLVDPPQIRSVSFASTGGALEGTHPLFICVAPYDSAGRRGPRSRTVQVYLNAATSTCTATISNISWPSGTWTGYLVYAGREEREMCFQQSGTGTPSSITIAGAQRKATEGPPESSDLGYIVKAKEILIPGAVKAIVTSLPSTTTAICSALAGGSVDYTGETAMVIGDASDGFPPIRAWTISAYNTSTGQFTFSRTHAGTDPLQAGDTILVLARATAATSGMVVCSRLSLAPGAYLGATVRIFAGSGAGQARRISGNDATTVFVDEPWDATPVSTSYFWIETSEWQYSADSPAPGIVDAGQTLAMRIPLENFEGRTILAMGFLVDDEGGYGYEDDAPFRVVEIVGASGVAVGNDPPGPIRSFAAGTLDYASEPGFLLIAVTFLPPSPAVNNFDRVKCWITINGGDEIEVNTVTHPVGSAGAGSGIIRIALPTAANWINVLLWGASGSATYQNSLVTASGAGQTPYINLGTITAATPGATTPATNLAAITATVDTSIPGMWRITGTVTFPTPRTSIDRFTLYLDGPIVSGIPQMHQPFDGDLEPPTTGTYAFATSWFDRPDAAESYQIVGTVRNASGETTDSPTASAILSVPPISTGGSPMLISNLVVTRLTPVQFDADGNEQSEFVATWNNPTSPDAWKVLITVVNPDDSGDTDRATNEPEVIDEWGGPGASRSSRIGPWATIDGERTTFKFWTINRSGDRLASFVSTTVTVTAQAFQQATAFSTGTPDYATLQGAADVPVTITAPADPRIVEFVIYQVRGGVDKEIGAVQVTPSATVTSKVTVELPTDATTSVTLKATPRRKGGPKAPLSGSTATAIVSINPDNQVSASFNGTIQATLPTTIAATPGSIGEQLIVETTNSVAGGATLTWGSGFEAPGMEPWPDGSSRTRWTFQCLDRSGTKKWVLTAVLFGV